MRAGDPGRGTQLWASLVALLYHLPRVVLALLLLIAACLLPDPAD